jgi:2-polyprenyl-3-methyl-5-hydroxy-6-metoxy-1,4-benzoquinol methylase
MSAVAFICPSCRDTGTPLQHDGGNADVLICSRGHRWPVRGGIARFVADDEYAASFGMQWNHFRKTQIDRYNGTTISRDRFRLVTGWDLDALAGKRVLDAGCGAGRFAQVALDAGAHVVALDLSSAVDACMANLGPHPRLTVVQASLYDLPLAPGSFDFVYSIGVLQHTPDVERAVKALPPMLAPGGQLACWIYEKKLSAFMTPRYPLRLITTRIPQDRLFSGLQRCMPALLAASDLAAAVPVAGPYLRKLVPVANYRGILPLDRQQRDEWALLDTFDWFSPAYDQPQTWSTVSRWLRESGCTDVARIPGRRIGLPVTARRPSAGSA